MRRFLKRELHRGLGLGSPRRGRYVLVGTGDIARSPTIAQRAAALGYTIYASLKAHRWQARAAVAAGILLLGTAVLPLAGTSFASRQIQSALALLGMRSPGERAAGQLVDTKPARLAESRGPRVLGKSAPAPSERAFGKVFPPQGFAPFAGDVPFTPPYMPDALQVPGLASAMSVPSGGGSGAPGGEDFSSGGSGGTPGGGAPGGGTPVAAVPEPGTWLMMIIAFGLSGSMLRRQRRRVAGRPVRSTAL